jgi:HEAT repeat protein
MDALQQRAADLNELAVLRPNPERRALVRAALDDKFEGIQSAALKVLGAWGDTESCALLRDFLVTAFDRPYGWSIRGVAIKALVPHIRGDDKRWLLDFYFDVESRLAKHEVLPLVLALPPGAARDRLVNALGDDDPVNRQAAIKAIGNMPYDDRRELIAALKDDPDEPVRNSARLLMRR